MTDALFVLALASAQSAYAPPPPLCPGLTGDRLSQCLFERLAPATSRSGLTFRGRRLDQPGSPVCRFKPYGGRVAGMIGKALTQLRYRGRPGAAMVGQAGGRVAYEYVVYLADRRSNGYYLCTYFPK